MAKQHIFLIGFMGTGKSAVAAELSRRLKISRMEMDDEIVRSQKMSINAIFEKYGEGYFRKLESDLLAGLYGKEQMVISCGGGAVMKIENVECMKKSGETVLLTARPETVYYRVKDNQERPILKNNMSVEFISELMEQRRKAYESAADIIIETDEKSISQIGSEIIERLTALDKNMI